MKQTYNLHLFQQGIANVNLFVGSCIIFKKPFLPKLYNTQLIPKNPQPKSQNPFSMSNPINPHFAMDFEIYNLFTYIYKVGVDR